MPQISTLELQKLLNKVGGLLVTDGQSGPATRQAISDARVAAGLPPGDQADDALVSWLQTQPDPSPVVPTEGVVFIARQEVSSRAYYDGHCSMPTWPGGESGITIGIGYDLRFQSDFTTCWKPCLPAATSEALTPWIGKQGSQAAAAALSSLRIPFFDAWKVFTETTLPAEVKSTESVYGDLTRLPGLCRAALVSLVYNRGTSLTGDGRREMATIRDLINANKLTEVPAQFISMERLWPTVAGLRQRRADEANLWTQGLKQAGLG